MSKPIPSARSLGGEGRVNPSLNGRPTLVDTNIFLRYLVIEDEGKAERCRLLFERTVAGEERLYSTSLVIAELVWVLQRLYGWERGEIAESLALILQTHNLHFAEASMLLAALETYARSGVDFIDAYHAALLEEGGERRLYSYDEDFDKIAGLERVEP